MRTFFLIFALHIFSGSSAQQRYEYYNWQWKPCAIGNARFVSNIKKTDSGWLRYDFFIAGNTVQMAGLYADSATKIENGSFNYFYADGNLQRSGQYKNKKREGLWMEFYRNGMMRDSTVYENGEPVGTGLGWHLNGYMSDSIVREPGKPAVAIYWYDNGQAAAAGRMMGSKLQGAWTYFHRNGNTAANELYDAGKLVSRVYYNESGEKLADTANRDRGVSFPGGSEGWKRFMLKHIYFPDQYKLVNTDVITVVVSATIAEDGTVTEAAVDTPFDPAFDKIALAIFRKCPKWIPAISHNRNVKQTIRQPISFMQQD